MALNSTLIVDWGAVLTAVGDLGNPSVPLAKRVAYTLGSGTGANQADVIFADTRTITASATDSLDLIGGGLLNPLGAAFAPARLKGLLVVAAGANTNDVQVVRPAANGVPIFLAAGDGVAVRPGGVFCWIAPDAVGVVVSPGTGDLLSLVNSAGTTSVTYDIVIIGASG